MFSDELRRFILRIPSIPFLEALLLLRSAPSQTWDADTVARRLYINSQQAIELLKGLVAARVCMEVTHSPECFIYKPESDELCKLIDDLASEYAHNLIEVTNLIHANSNQDRKIHLLADAFVLRKES
jgi:hypothetical protein